MRIDEVVDLSGWREYDRKLEDDRQKLQVRTKRKAARNKPCVRCGEMCHDAPHFKAGYSPGGRRAAPECPKKGWLG